MSVGLNYLTVCDQASGSAASEALDAAAGIRGVLTGTLPRYTLEYPCDSADERRWFRMIVAPREAHAKPGAIVMHTDITGNQEGAAAMRAAERVARDSDMRLGFALAAADIGDWSIDLRTNQAQRSLRHDECFGYRELLPEWSYETLLSHVDPLDRNLVEHRFTTAMSGPGEYDAEFRTRWADSSLHWLWMKGRVYFDDLGAPIRVAGIVADITARKQAEARLLESEQRLELATESAQIGIWDWDIPGGGLLWDAKMREIYGIGGEKSAMTHDDWRDFVHPDDVTRVLAAGAAALEDRAPYHSEFRIVRPDGAVRHIEAHASVQRSDDGAPARMIGLNRDITERKVAEMAAGRLADIVASSDDAIIGKDLTGIVTSWNHGAVKIFGYSAAEMIGHSILRLIPPDRHDEEREVLARVSRGESFEHLETRRQTKDGRIIDISMTASPIRDAGGRSVAVSTVARDISERKRLEQQFLRAQRMESIGTLAGGIAHDLNNALAPIILSIELLRMTFPDEESQELLSVIHTSARHGAEMVKQVLSFARGVEGRRLDLQVRDLVHDIGKITQDTFLKHIQVRTRCEHALWGVIGDPTQLHQVLMNLCVNARDAMPDGGILTVSADNVLLDVHYAALNLEAQAGPYVVLRVEDTGTGIPASVIEKIFEPFFTTKEVGTGTGLGLSTSMAIVKSHNGFIRVYSEQGHGTKFEVYLPAQTNPTAPVPTAEVELPRGHGELVLVVDDEPSVRQITQQTLEAFGYRVVLAHDGAEAIAIYAARRPEIAVVLTDMMMPVMDGPTTIRVLRRMNPAVRIIAASGLTTHEHASRSGNSMIQHFLAKPYTADVLLQVLRDCLRP